MCVFEPVKNPDQKETSLTVSICAVMHIQVIQKSKVTYSAEAALQTHIHLYTVYWRTWLIAIVMFTINSCSRNLNRFLLGHLTSGKDFCE